MAGKILSDDEMAQLEGSAKPAKKVLSDAEMAAMEGVQESPISIRGSAQNLAREAPSHRPRNASDLRAMGEAALVGPAQALTLGHVPQIAGGITSLIKGTPYVQERDQTAKDIDEIKKRAPWTFGLANLGTNLAIPVKAAATIPGAMAVGALQGGAYNPGDKEGVVDPAQIKERLTNALMGGVFGGGMKLAGNAGDRLMQKAVGRTKYNPGVGKSLADEGIWGTRNMMKNQVNDKAQEIAMQTKDLAANHPNLISSQPIADEVSALNDKWKMPSGRANSPLDAPTMLARERYANEINRRGMQPAEDILQDRINAGQRVPDKAWENRDAQERLLTEVSKAEQRGASNVLKDNVPGIRELDPRYVAIAKARKPLNREESIGGNPAISPSMLSTALRAAAGGSLGLSTMGRLGIGAEKHSPAMLRSLLEQMLASPKYKPEDGK